MIEDLAEWMQVCSQVLKSCSVPAYHFYSRLRSWAGLRCSDWEEIMADFVLHLAGVYWTSRLRRNAKYELGTAGLGCSCLLVFEVSVVLLRVLSEKDFCLSRSCILAIYQVLSSNPYHALLFDLGVSS